MFSRTLANMGPAKRITHLKNTRTGVCYVLGDGSSLSRLDPQHLRNCDVIFVGATPSIEGFSFDSTRSFWVFPEPEVLLNVPLARIVGIVFRRSLRPPSPFRNWKSFGYFRRAYVEVFKLMRGAVIFIHLSNVTTIARRRVFSVFRRFPDQVGLSGITEPFKGSLYAALSIAVLLGYKEVRLLGFDYLLDPPLSGHWYEMGSGVVSQELLGHYEPFFETIRDRIEIKHVLFDSQKSQIQALWYEDLFGPSQRSEQLMNPVVRDFLSRSGLYRFTA